jgi:hypothetical protein
MSIKTFYPNDQTRRSVITAYQGGTTAIGWVLDSSGAGIIFNPAWPSGDQLRAIPAVASTLTSINPTTGLLVIGNSGIAITSAITRSTTTVSGTPGMLSDDYAAAQYLRGLVFESGKTFILQ